jgi:hypothetical protein
MKPPPLHVPLSTLYLCVECDNVTNAAGVCPSCTCHQLLSLAVILSREEQPGSKAGHRICSVCDCRIRRHDRWYFGADRRPRHNDCDAPSGTPLPEMGRLL